MTSHAMAIFRFVYNMLSVQKTKFWRNMLKSFCFKICLQKKIYLKTSSSRMKQAIWQIWIFRLKFFKIFICLRATCNNGKLETHKNLQNISKKLIILFLPQKNVSRNCETAAEVYVVKMSLIVKTVQCSVNF